MLGQPPPVIFADGERLLAAIGVEDAENENKHHMLIADLDRQIAVLAAQEKIAA